MPGSLLSNSGTRVRTGTNQLTSSEHLHASLHCCRQVLLSLAGSKDVRMTTAEGKVFQSVEQANLACTVENGTEADGEQPTAAAEASKMEGEPSSDTNCKAANFEESAEAAKPHAQPKEDAAADSDATNAEAASADQEEAGDDHGATPDEQGGRDASKAVPAPQVSLRRSVRVKETAQPAKENKKGGKKHKGKAPKGKQQVLSEKLEMAAKPARTRAKKQAADKDMNEAPAGKAPRKGNDASAAKTLAKKAAASRNPAKRESQEQNASDVEEPAKEAAQLRRSGRGQKRKEPVDTDSKQDGEVQARSAILKTILLLVPLAYNLMFFLVCSFRCQRIFTGPRPIPSDMQVCSRQRSQKLQRCSSSILSMGAKQSGMPASQFKRDQPRSM